MPTIPQKRKTITERMLEMVAWRPGVALTRWKPKILSKDEKRSIKFIAAFLDEKNRK